MKTLAKDIQQTAAENQRRAEMGNDGTGEREDNETKREKLKKRAKKFLHCSVS
jgi:hypothetical protein